MAGSHGKILDFRGPSNVRQPIRRAWPQSPPGLNAVKIRSAELGKVTAEGINDALHADGVDFFVQTRNLHGAAHAQFSIHRRHGDPRLGANGTELWKLPRLWQCKTVTFS